MKLLLITAACCITNGVFGQRAEVPSDAGATARPTPRVNITIEGDTRIIRSNGLPDHRPGAFPRRGNPNTIAAPDFTFRVTMKPRPADELRSGRGAWFGVALNGVPFEPGTGEFWNGSRDWNYEAMTGKLDLGIDEHHAHVQPGGVYHYQGLPTGFVESHGGDRKMILVGYAADGFPIYNAWGHVDPRDPQSPLKKLRSSWRLREGTRPGAPAGPGGNYDGTFTADFQFVEGSGELDQANGRNETTPEYPDGIYHYVITDDYPYLPRFWCGTPDESFFKRGPGPGGPGGPGGPPGRRGPRRDRPPPPP